MEKIEGSEGVLLVSYTFGIKRMDGKGDVDLLIVGKKRPDQAIEVVNAFQDEEARALYQLLTEKKKRGDSQ